MGFLVTALAAPSTIRNIIVLFTSTLSSGNIFLASLIPLAIKFKERGKEELREIYIIPKEKFPFYNEINIYDDKVAIISHQDQGGVIIQNQFIADTQRSIFKLGFKYAKIIEAKEYPELH